MKSLHGEKFRMQASSSSSTQKQYLLPTMAKAPERHPTTRNGCCLGCPAARARPYRAAMAALWVVGFLIETSGSGRLLFVGFTGHLRQQGGSEMTTPSLCRTLQCRTACRVRERRRSSPARSGEGAAKRLTSSISKARSTAAILNLLGKEVDGDIFNEFHMSAAFSRLAKFSQRRKLSREDVASPVWLRLLSRLCTMLKESMLDARGVANVFWAAAHLQDAAPQVLTAVPPVAECILQEVDAMDSQALSNIIWSVAKLQDAAPQVLIAVPAIAERIPRAVENMKPQELSNSLWSAANLQDAAPQVLTAVPAIAERIPCAVEGMKPQELSNSLWSAANLQEAAPRVLTAVPAIAERMLHVAKGMTPQELSNSLWSAANLQDAAPEVLTAVPAIGYR